VNSDVHMELIRTSSCSFSMLADSLIFCLRKKKRKLLKRMCSQIAASDTGCLSRVSAQRPPSSCRAALMSFVQRKEPVCLQWAEMDQMSTATLARQSTVGRKQDRAELWCSSTIAAAAAAPVHGRHQEMQQQMRPYVEVDLRGSSTSYSPIGRPLRQSGKEG
jgi:hypothetical protein